MKHWRFFNPVDVHFGAGVLDQVGGAIGGRSWVLVTHPDAPLLPWRDRLLAIAGQPVMVLDDVRPNPSLSMLRHVCDQLAAAPDRVELIVALGGGSVMDTAKFLAAGRGRFDPVFDHLQHGTVLEEAALPIIAIPTTAGTGSELTKWATVWDPDRGRKLSLNRDDLYAESAFIDPLITMDLPWSITLASGLDALSHALESIWNNNANPVTRAFAVAAAEDVMAGLLRVQSDPGDLDARTLLAQGAMRAGFAFSNTQTALAHNISYQVTLDHGIAHGIACSFCLPEVMAAAIGIDANCDAALRAIFGDLAAAPAKLRTVLDTLGAPSGPAAIGVGEDAWRKIVADAFDGPRGRNFLGSRDRFPSDSPDHRNILSS